MELPITREQAYFLNTVARVARLYRLASERIVRDLDDNDDRMAAGLVPTGIRPNDATDIATASAQLDILNTAKFWVFTGADEAKAKEHFKLAVNLPDSDYFTVKD